MEYMFLLFNIGHIKLNRRDQLCEEVKKTHKIIGKVLMELDDSNFNECYLHDFVKMVHDCHYKKAAYFELEFEVTLSDKKKKEALPSLHYFFLHSVGMLQSSCSSALQGVFYYRWTSESTAIHCLTSCHLPHLQV